jgi:hypothetical protein
VETFLHFGIGNAVMATILAVFAAVAGRCCRRPAVRHALWLLVLLKLLTPPLAPVPVAWPRIEAIHPPRDEAIAPVFDSFSSEPTESIALPEDSTLSAQTPPSEPPAEPIAFADFAAPLLITAWLGGSFIWWSVALWRRRGIRYLPGCAWPSRARGPCLAP